MKESRAPLSGLFWTIAPAALARFTPPATSGHTPFRVEVNDPVAGRVAITGALHAAPDPSRGLIVGLHGLGGSMESSYLRRFALAANAAGFSFLRLNARGADRSGADFYHAGLTADLDAVLAAPELARYRRRALLGFSLGGHVALRWAAERGVSAGYGPASVGAVVSVCAPVDLELGARALDAPGSWLYRRYVLPGLNAQIDAVERSIAARGGARFLSVDRERRLAARTIREWDGLVVAPRWGFRSAEDYYARASAAPMLGEIAIPCWMIASEADPMVPPWTLVGALGGISPSTELSWTGRGGHVGMPRDLDLGRGGSAGLSAQILSWLSARVHG